MHTIFLSLMIGLIAFTLMVTDAEAKRFGGGKSVGVSRQAHKSPNTATNGAAASQAATKPASSASKWLGPLAGLAIGGLLATMFMGHGLGSGLLLWLVIGAAAFFIWRFIRSKMQPAPIQARENANFQTATGPATGFSNPSLGSSSHSSRTIPGIDEAVFLRQAKALFIRLQAAYDNKNLADIREFTTTQVFAEVQLQIQERGNEINQTEVINIDAHLLDVSGEGQATIISVLFSGLIREQAGAGASSVRETWHFQKNIFNSNWLVAGIQQD